MCTCFDFDRFSKSCMRIWTGAASSFRSFMFNDQTKEELLQFGKSTPAPKNDKNLWQWCIFHPFILTCFLLYDCKRIFHFRNASPTMYATLQHIKCDTIKNNLVLRIGHHCAVVWLHCQYLLYSFHAFHFCTVRILYSPSYLQNWTPSSTVCLCVEACVHARCNINPIKSKLILIKSERMAFFIHIYR